MQNMNTPKLTEAITLINKLGIDIRAEVVIAELLENGFSADEIQAYFEGAFRRPSRKDIVSAQEDRGENSKSTLEIHLSRNGLYDSLPEAIFHQPTDESSTQSGFSTTYKKRKQEETNARKFFQPFENEFLHHRVEIERKERDSLNKISTLFDDFLIAFWKIDRDLSPQLLMKLLRLLPFAHRIAGNLNLVTKNLSTILNEQVDYTLSYDTVDAGISKKGLGNARLGQDLIIGGVTALIPKVTIQIGPINPDQVSDYLEGGDINKFLEVFYNYFLPMEMEHETKIKSTKKLSSAQNEYGRLGYTLDI